MARHFLLRFQSPEHDTRVVDAVEFHDVGRRFRLTRIESSMEV